MSAKFLLFVSALLLVGCHGTNNSTAREMPRTAATQPPHLQLLDELRANTNVLPPRQNRVELFAMYNREAPIPPQCYTRTEGKFNPCYVCHQNAIRGRENTMNDFHLQEAYQFSEIGATNHWKNLFVDRRSRVAQISDEEILRWIAEDNYSELPSRLRSANFQGWIPDLANLQLGAAAFDAQGIAKDGSQWVAFNYKPLPSTFWPTNGATDDVMIRLPEAFRTNSQHIYSRDIYLANLALVELSIKGVKQISTPTIDERKVAADLNGDGKLTPINFVRARKNFVGAAAKIAVTPFIYPQDTEFLHTVRYLGIAADGSIYNAPRMKEVRYMRRWLQSDAAQLNMWYEAENSEKDKGELPAYRNMGHRGLGTPMGWLVSGFIEDRNGRLRVNTFEETMFCMGCHNSIGSTIDKTFSFARKIDGVKGWGYIDLHGMPDAPNIGEQRGEIVTYLERSGGGSEFRNNPEMEKRFYRADGSLNAENIAAAKDVYDLVAPSRERALMLNKAYKAIVETQSYLFGRDPSVQPPVNVYETINTEEAPTLPAHLQYAWDIRLDWSAKNNTKQ